MLTDHKTNECNEAIQITPLKAADGEEGATYELCFPIPVPPDHAAGFSKVLLQFQNGPVKERGVNGVTNEALLAIVIDRLRRFQSGPYSCRENALALTKCEEALQWLHHRTRLRVQRGVEGTNQQ